jgi:hypothetical protein
MLKEGKGLLISKNLNMMIAVVMGDWKSGRYRRSGSDSVKIRKMESGDIPWVAELIRRNWDGLKGKQCYREGDYGYNFSIQAEGFSEGFVALGFWPFPVNQ